MSSKANELKNREELVKQLRETIKRKNIPTVSLPLDENGHMFVDKNQHPELYDWAVNG